MKKVYHLHLTIKQFRKRVSLVTRVFGNIYQATEAIKELNDIFHNTLLEVKLVVLEEE